MPCSLTLLPVTNTVDGHSSRNAITSAAMKSSSDSYDEAGDNEALLGEAEARGPLKSSSKTHLTKCSIFLLLCISVILGLVVGLIIGSSLLRPSYNQYVRQTTQSSKARATTLCEQRLTATAPLLEDVTIHYSTHQFNGSFMKENIYRQKGSPEVDAAWEALGVNCQSLPASPSGHSKG